MYNEKGIWLDNNLIEHKYDSQLNKKLIEILNSEKVKTIIDLGCGPGMYSEFLNQNGFFCDCCDGNPHTIELSKHKCFIQDLSIDFDLQKKYDCVLCLEVGEHIPKLYEDILIDNIIKHTEKLIILSWATVGQGGHGHVNEQPNEYISKKFENKDFERCYDIEIDLRKSSFWWWFKNTIMVFKKK